LKILQKHFKILIVPTCLIIGLIRMNQIQTYQSSIGRPTMTGIFTLFSYLLVGICLVIISLLFTGIYHRKLNNILKIVFIIIALIIVLTVIFLLLMYH